ncbi:MAG: NAD(P)H-hydrate dehydratase [Candidatus Pacebacteria bacterium]|nr:NAD(P)H-hydrate dehydratase [Candidatus Paceibacterota bacterium]
MNLKTIYLKRGKWAHKGDFGNVLIVAGSRMYSGSPIFNAMSALRCGADLISVVGHRRAMDIVANFLPDMITHPLEDGLLKNNADEVFGLSSKFHSLVIGGGLDRSEESHRAIRAVISKIELPMIIDAEAVRAVAGYEEILKGKKVVLTPNVPELEALTGEKVGNSVEEREEKVRACAEKFGAVVVLKGNVDVISDGEKTILNRTGNPFMSKGGFGDTLAGVCGALLARGVEPLEAARWACFINGTAGDLAAKKFGESLIASDIFDFFPKAIKGDKK